MCRYQHIKAQYQTWSFYSSYINIKLLINDDKNVPFHFEKHCSSERVYFHHMHKQLMVSADK